MALGLMSWTGCLRWLAGDDPAPPPPEVVVEAAAPAPDESLRVPRTPMPAAIPDPTPAERAGGPAADPSVRDAMGEIRLADAQARGAARRHYEQAQKLVQDLRYLEADRQVAEALRLDPNLEEARELRDQIRFILGDYVSAPREEAMKVLDEMTVKSDQARVEIMRLYTRGVDLLADDDYDGAIRAFEDVLTSIRYFPYKLGLEGLEVNARGNLEKAKQLKAEAEARARRDLERLTRERAKAERVEDLRYQENRIRELMERAQDAMDRQDYEDAEEAAGFVLKLDPDHRDARRLEAIARERRHLKRRLDILVQDSENWSRTIRGIEESAIPYHQILRFPPAREWERISRKSVRITERIAAALSPEHREIEQKLGERKSITGFDDKPFADVIEFLRQISDLNFVLTKEALEQSADLPIRLDAYTDVPLRLILEEIMKATKDAGFRYEIRSGAILIGPTASLKPTLYLEFYEVSEIVQARPDFPAPKLALEEEEGTEAAGGFAPIMIEDESERKVTVGGEMLQEMIQENILSKGEEEEGTSIKLQGGKLAIRTTLAKHRQVEKLLEELRKQLGIVVTVAARFLDVQDNFLESIGVEWGSPATTFLPNPIPDVDGVATSVAPGFEFIDAQGQTDVRIASLARFTRDLGSQVPPFNISQRGGLGFQYNAIDLERYQLEAIIHAVGKGQHARRLDAPQVTAFNLQTSHSLVIRQQAYVKDLEVNQTGVIPVVNPVIGVLNSGSMLEVKPTVTYDRKFVILEIQPTLAETLGFNTAQLNLSGQQTVVPVRLPIMNVTKIKTTITIPDGGTVLVGGLKRFIEMRNTVGIPILRELPVLNILTGRAGESVLRSNLFVLINAKITVVRDEEKKQFGQL